MESVLLPYVNLNDRDFVKVSQKLVNDMFDWAIQTSRICSNIKSVLLGSETEKSSSVKIIDYIDTILGNELKGIKPNTEHPLFET
jgi:hypothetical protein